MTIGYVKRKFVDEEMRYKHGYDRGLKGQCIVDRKGHTKVYLRGIADGLKVFRKVERESLTNQAVKKLEQQQVKREQRERRENLAVVECRNAEDKRRYLRQLDEALDRARAAENRGRCD